MSQVNERHDRTVYASGSGTEANESSSHYNSQNKDQSETSELYKNKLEAN